MIGSGLMRRMHASVYSSRLRVLTRIVIERLNPNDRILDVGCGNGQLLKSILNDPACPTGVTGVGVERNPRGGEPVTVIEYQGGRMPFADASFDLVICADVLHHEEREDELLRECARVARRAVMVKDHARDGLFAQSRISLMDWAANAPYGVVCLYRYHTLVQWREMFTRCQLRMLTEMHPLPLYPAGWELIFGGRLQYIAFVVRADHSDHGDHGDHGDH